MWRPPSASASALAIAAGRADRAALADALDAERVQRRRRLDERGRELRAPRPRSAARSRAATVRCRPRRGDLLGQHRAEPLDRAADDLALGQQRVDDPARVVDRDEPQHAHAPGRALDLDDRRVGAGGEDLVGLEARRARRRRPAGRRPPRRPPSRPSRSSGSRTSRRPSRERVRVAGDAPSRASRRPRAGRRRSARTASGGPARRASSRPRPRTSPSRVTDACSNSPPERSTHSATPVPHDARPARRRRRRPTATDADRRRRPDGERDCARTAAAAAASSRAPCPGSARSRRSRTSSRARSGAGTRARGCGGAARPGRCRARARRRRSSSRSGSVASGRPGAAVGPGRDLVGARAGDEDLDGRDVVAAG